MQLLVRIYYNAVFGALGGLLGWMLFGVFGDPITSYDKADGAVFSQGELNDILGGAIIGGLIGYFVVSVEAIRDRALVKFARLSSYGFLLGAVGGALGMYLAEKINHALIGMVDNLFMRILARGIGWSFLG